MFFHYNLVLKENYEFKGNVFEIAIYRAEEDKHLNAFISSGGFSQSIAKISGDTSYDIKTEASLDPVDMLLSIIKSEIDEDKFKVP